METPEPANSFSRLLGFGFRDLTFVGRALVALAIVVVAFVWRDGFSLTEMSPLIGLPIVVFFTCAIAIQGCNPVESWIQGIVLLFIGAYIRELQTPIKLAGPWFMLAGILGAQLGTVGYRLQEIHLETYIPDTTLAGPPDVSELQQRREARRARRKQGGDPDR